jgi:hypothetical protein
MEWKQAMAAFSVLSFLGTAALLASAGVAFIATWAIGERRLSRGATAISQWVFTGRGLNAKIAAAATVLAGGYVLVLLGASFASQTWALGPDEEKYFCEVDCHIAYSVTGVTQSKTLGADANIATASGTFYVVKVRTRFDERTISSHRGDAPLVPSPRAVTIEDDEEREYPVSAAGEDALAKAGGAGTEMTQALRPGEFYTTQIVFDLPADARHPRLLISSPTNPTWIGRLLIGDENSLFHKKVFFRLS